MFADVAEHEVGAELIRVTLDQLSDGKATAPRPAAEVLYGLPNPSPKPYGQMLDFRYILCGLSALCGWQRDTISFHRPGFLQ